VRAVDMVGLRNKVRGITRIKSRRQFYPGKIIAGVAGAGDHDAGILARRSPIHAS
jgi:hypothetical protein